MVYGAVSLVGHNPLLVLGTTMTSLLDTSVEERREEPEQ